MDLKEFNNEMLNPLMEKLSLESKNIYLMGDYNIDLMKIEVDVTTSQFFDTITSNLFVPHITCPTRITNTTSTLDNIFSNSLNFMDGITGNLAINISDQFTKKHNLFKRDKENFDRENFILDLLEINWVNIISIDKNHPNHSFNSFETKINSLIDTYLPLKKLTNKEINLQFKPWITCGIRKSIQRRDDLYKRFIQAKDIHIKEDYYKRYKKLRNQIVTLCRESKMLHYQQFFTENANNMKNTWKGIKSIINIRSNTKSIPTSVIVNNNISSGPTETANSFTNYFSSIASKLQGKIYQNGKDFTHYLQK